MKKVQPSYFSSLGMVVYSVCLSVSLSLSFSLSLIVLLDTSVKSRILQTLKHLSIHQQLFSLIIKDIRSMRELLNGVGTFTNRSSLFDTQSLKFVTMKELKFVSTIFIIFFIFSLNDSPSNIMKNVFYFI